MHHFTFWGTQTGRISVSDRNANFASLYGSSLSIPREKAGLLTKKFWETYPSIKKYHDTILNIDYQTLEQRAISTYLTKYKIKPQDIYVMAEPIELNQLESFRVEMTVPNPPQVDLLITKERGGITISKLQDLLTPKCGCEMKILMRAGCQCGGA